MPVIRDRTVARVQIYNSFSIFILLDSIFSRIKGEED